MFDPDRTIVRSGASGVSIKNRTLQPAFPTAPSPVTTIADVLQLKQGQRFDLMAILAQVMSERQSGAGQIIIDVRLIDGSQDSRDST